MQLSFDQSGYWNKVAGLKTFNHEINWAWLESLVGPKDRVLDYGCGYGRLVQEFKSRNFKKVTGIDNAAAMIASGKSAHPELDLRVNQSAKIPFDSGTFDLVLLFAVLTCIPGNDDQIQLIEEIHRVLKKGGLLYISDLLLNKDERNLQRYRTFSSEAIPYGVFKLQEGAVCRHHSEAYLSGLLKAFTVVHHQTFEVKTMNGNSSRAIQILLKK